ncbi:NADH-quinone oxidoreductase subunit J [Ferrithrix thermotolerans DSM 19514]|uniref:NADH-quinone oxidoreductase subunit J n=1 Tax=Ferrithrix thermotolerans DSM 19514 TaxID=1121881 RepID=A0A1M4SQ74_9ACTN|nr:NADH-quinone oxidoreductase subunit J [Ferrithrix thermotolerans]SHE34348.1 NADH-quinone oxidoreductase subunit J [Ferrithrix thermotolerans DSM 19514]
MFAAISAPDFFTFAAAAIAAVAGAIGVVTLRHPVHAALMLVMTFFAIAVLFVEQGAQFLAAVQVIVYAGAIVVLFLFVIMLLGVDKKETVFPKDSVSWKLPAGLVLSIAILVELSILAKGVWATGAHSVTAAPNGHSNVGVLARAVFTTYLLPFEATSVLLVIAVLGAVVLARVSKIQEDISSESALEDEMGEVNAR